MLISAYALTPHGGCRVFRREGTVNATNRPVELRGLAIAIGACPICFSERMLGVPKMTTPWERVRAVRLGAELLACMKTDAAVDARYRDHAAALLDRYPRWEEWEVRADRPTSAPPIAEAEVIFEAGVLFGSLAPQDRMARETADLWQTVMRHFPSSQDGCRNPQQVWRVFRQDAFGLADITLHQDEQGTRPWEST